MEQLQASINQLIDSVAELKSGQDALMDAFTEWRSHQQLLIPCQLHAHLKPSATVTFKPEPIATPSTGTNHILIQDNHPKLLQLKTEDATPGEPDAGQPPQRNDADKESDAQGPQRRDGLQWPDKSGGSFKVINAHIMNIDDLHQAYYKGIGGFPPLKVLEAHPEHKRTWRKGKRHAWSRFNVFVKEMEEAGGPESQSSAGDEEEEAREHKIRKRADELQQLFSSQRMSLNTFSDKFAAKAFAATTTG